jgi:hypothetical protein
MKAPVVYRADRTGIQGARIRLAPHKEDSLLLSTDNLIQKGEIVDAGRESKFKNYIGKIAIVEDWRIVTVQLGDEVMFYVPDEGVVEII